MKTPLLTAVVLPLLLTPVAQAGYYAHHDDIGGALEDILDGYGRPNDDCPLPGDPDYPSDDPSCDEEDPEGGGQGDAVDPNAGGDEGGDDLDSGDAPSAEPLSWMEWLMIIWEALR